MPSRVMLEPWTLSKTVALRRRHQPPQRQILDLRPGTMGPRLRGSPHSSSFSRWCGVPISGRFWPAWLGEPRGNHVMPHSDDPLDTVQRRVAIPDLEGLDLSSTDPATI
jgi:hypothetical protein